MFILNLIKKANQTCIRQEQAHEFGIWFKDFRLLRTAPVLQLDHDTLPGHGGEAIVGNTLGIALAPRNSGSVCTAVEKLLPYDKIEMHKMLCSKSRGAGVVT